MGWQRQSAGLSVQGLLEAALYKLTGEAIAARAAGRTDAGVHARGQVVSFRTTSALPVRAFAHGVNTFLPENISVLSAEEATPDFDARRDAKGKWYHYQIWNEVARSALHTQLFAHVRKTLDVVRMREAAHLLVGTHDFGAFRAADCERVSTTRTLFHVGIDAISCAPRGQEIHIHVVGDGFLKQMVRILSGTLILIGEGRFAPEKIAALLLSGDRTQAGTTAPARGLFLEQVFYEKEPHRWPYSRGAL